MWVRVPLPAPKKTPRASFLVPVVGREQGGGEAASNSPVDCCLARGRVPIDYRSISCCAYTWMSYKKTPMASFLVPVVGLEKGGGEAASNSPVDCCLARGRVPIDYRSISCCANTWMSYKKTPRASFLVPVVGREQGGGEAENNRPTDGCSAGGEPSVDYLTSID